MVEGEWMSLSSLVGGFGLYQVLQYMLVLLPVVFASISNTNYVFAASQINYRCLVPECELSNSSVDVPAWWPAAVEDHRCSRPLLAPTFNSSVRTCRQRLFTNLTEPCTRWIYSNDQSFVAQFGLACQEWKRALVGTLHNVGVLISMPMMGYISDKWGRRTAIICSAVGVVIGSFKTLVQDGKLGYLEYVLLEVLEAAIVTGSYTTCFVLLLELGGKERRVLSSACVGFAIAAGELILSLVVWLVPERKQFQLIIYLPALAFLIYIFLLNESLRWLLTNQKNDKALVLIQKMSKTNGSKLTEQMKNAIKHSRISFDSDVKVETEKFRLGLLFSSCILIKRLLVCSFWWFTSAFVFYGLIINSVSLPGNKIANFALSSLASIPGDIAALLALDRFGRRKTLFTGFILCGICCVTNGLLPSGASTWQIVVYLLGKAAISLCFNCVYVYTSELVPTSARGSFVGACSMLARVGSILAPLTPLLRSWWVSLPTLLFGCAALCAGALLSCTPETNNRPLPDTIAQAENMHRMSHIRPK